MSHFYDLSIRKINGSTPLGCHFKAALNGNRRTVRISPTQKKALGVEQDMFGTPSGGPNGRVLPVLVSECTERYVAFHGKQILCPWDIGVTLYSKAGLRNRAGIGREEQVA